MFEFLTQIVEVSPDPEGKINSVQALVSIVLNLMIGLGLALTLVTIAYSGILYMTSGGDAKATGRAKAALTYTIVAFFLTLASVTAKFILLRLVGADTPYLLNDVPF